MIKITVKLIDSLKCSAFSRNILVAKCDIKTDFPKSSHIYTWHRNSCTVFYNCNGTSQI